MLQKVVSMQRAFPAIENDNLPTSSTKTAITILLASDAAMAANLPEAVDTVLQLKEKEPILQRVGFRPT